MRSSLQSSRSQQGFTLIELVVVIVILGILAVTAAPKFVDLSSDAKSATLDGAKAAIQSARDLQYAKSAIAGGTPAYPVAASIAGLITLDGFTENSGTKGQFDITGESNCYTKYNFTASNAMPTVSIENSGC
jgi:MSHA pilin protein MshA